MWLRSTLFGLSLLLLTLGAVVVFPTAAQTPSVFPFTLQQSSLVACWFYGVSFSATPGEQFTLQWSENVGGVGPVSVNFYIAPLADVQQIWYCDTGPLNVYWNDGAFATANWAPSVSGAYAVLVVNYSNYPVSGMISIAAPNATLSATAIGPATVRRVLPPRMCPFPGCMGP